MISIVICHRNKELLTSLQSNIASTIGTEYELVIIDNSHNEYSILSAYNEGVKKSKFEIICFMHEDMLYHSQNWGQKVISHFNDPEVGMIGIEGGLAQSQIPSAWWYNNYFSKSAINLLMKDRVHKRVLYHHICKQSEEIRTEAIIVDGIWFCIRRSLFSKISFDEKTFKGFHLYDADISMQVNNYTKIFVIYDILLEHFWQGKISSDFYTDLVNFSKKWNKSLPLQTKDVPSKYMNYYNWHALRNFSLEISSKNFSKKEITDIIKLYYPLAKDQYNSWWFRSYFLLSKFFGFSNTNRIYYRLEKIVGFCNINSYRKLFLKETQSH